MSTQHLPNHPESTSTIRPLFHCDTEADAEWRIPEIFVITALLRWRHIFQYPIHDFQRVVAHLSWSPGSWYGLQIKNQTYSCSVAPKETQFLHVLCHFSVGSLKSTLHPVHGVTTSDPQPWEGFGPCLPYRSYSRASTKWSGDHEKVSSVSIQNWLWIGELR